MWEINVRNSILELESCICSIKIGKEKAYGISRSEIRLFRQTITRFLRWFSIWYLLEIIFSASIILWISDRLWFDLPWIMNIIINEWPCIVTSYIKIILKWLLINLEENVFLWLVFRFEVHNWLSVEIFLGWRCIIGGWQLLIIYDCINNLLRFRPQV